MNNFSENEIKEILGEETTEKKEKNHKILTAVGIGAVIVAVILAIVIPLSTLKNDETPDIGGNKHNVSPITDFEYSISDGYATISKYIGDGEVVVVPEEIEGAAVKHIGDEAFNGSENVKEVIMPDSIITIGHHAFSGMNSLTKVRLPEMLESIGNSAFWLCSSLKEIDLPESVTSIGDSVFFDCNSLTIANIPTNITEIPDGLFHGCSSLKTITLPENVTSIGDFAFATTGLTDIVFPESLNSIGAYAFSRTSVPELTFPDSTENIGTGAFSECLSLSKVVIPKKITEISEECFRGCTKLYSVLGTENITRVGAYAFRNCTEMPMITFYSPLEEIDNEAFAGCEKLAEIVLPENLERIGDNAFERCKKLTKINLPSSLKTIGASAFTSSGIISVAIPENTETMGEKCFYACESLREVEIKANLRKIEPSTFMECRTLRRVQLNGAINTIGENAFSGCVQLSDITISEGLETIETGAFYGCKKMNKIILPESVRNISTEMTFRDCASLSEFTFPEGFERLSGEGSILLMDVFRNCNNLREVNLPSTFSDERIGAIFKDLPCDYINVAKENETFSQRDEGITNKDGNYIYFIDKEALGGTTIRYSEYYRIPQNITGMSPYSLDTLPAEAYIIGHKNLEIPEDVIGKRTVSKDRFIFNAHENKDEVTINTLKSICDLQKTDSRFVIHNPLSLYMSFDFEEDLTGIVFKFISSIYPNESYSAYVYPVANSEFYSAEQYIHAPQTFYSEALGEYRVCFTTDTEPGELIQTTDFTDYFMIFIVHYNTDRGDIYAKCAEICQRNFPDAVFDSTSGLEPFDAITPNKETDYNTVITSIGGLVIYNPSLLFEFYPSGYYGDNGEEVLTTANGQFRYSIRAINQETGEIYY